MSIRSQLHGARGTKGPRRVAVVTAAIVAGTAAVLTAVTGATTASAATAPPSGYHQLVVNNDSLCVDVAGNSTSNNAVIDQWSCKSSGNANQEWQFNAVSSGYGELQNQNSGKDLVVQGASKSNGAKIIQYTQNGTTNGLWKPIQLSNGSWQFQNENSGLCLDVTGAVSTLGVQLDQWPCKSSAAGSNQAFAARSVGSGGGGLLFSPYKDVTINMNWNTFQMQSAVEGTVMPVVGPGSLVSNYIPNLPAISLAFATGACGSENWGGVPAASWAAENIPQLSAAGLKYVVSTGGEAGTFTCGSAAGMESFIARYASPDLVGIDFDIEGGQSASDIASLVSSAVGAQSQYPNLRFSFTLATLAASDGSYGGVNSLGNEVVEAVLGSGLKNYVINLMTMDYGSPSSSVCVVVSGSCEMGQSAIQAVKNLEHTYGIPASKIGVTPMIGLNDTNTETFTAADVDTLTAYALSNGLAEIHYWSLDRDTPCPSPQTYASPTCNSVSGTTPLEYTHRFLNDGA